MRLLLSRGDCCKIMVLPGQLLLPVYFGTPAPAGLPGKLGVKIHHKQPLVCSYRPNETLVNCPRDAIISLSFCAINAANFQNFPSNLKVLFWNSLHRTAL